jgi:hypothetical protein
MAEGVVVIFVTPPLLFFIFNLLIGIHQLPIN